ncbi:hypothetical protein WDW89_06720 [Deltaproteobacteria bacterium TL4]
MKFKKLMHIFIAVTLFLMMGCQSASDEEDTKKSSQPAAEEATETVDVATITAGKVEFTDENKELGKLSGTLTVTPASDESLIAGYTVYWGSNATTKLGDAIVSFDKTGAALTHPFVNQAIPASVAYILVFSKSEKGEATSNVFIKIKDVGAPKVKAQGVSFKDIDEDKDQLEGEISIVKAENEDYVTSYVVYWGSNATTKLEKITEIVKTGRDLSHSIVANTPLPTNATRILVFTKNNDDEMAEGISVLINDLNTAINQNTVVDVVIPTVPAVSIDFTDTDLDEGEIAGILTIQKAIDESDLTHYVLYWSEDGKSKLFAEPIATLKKTGNDLTYIVKNDTKIPEKAAYFMVFTRSQAEMLSGIRALFKDIKAPAPITQVVAGYAHTCALSGDGRVRCWGSGNLGRLGNNLLKDSPVPVFVTDIRNAVQLSSDAHNCVLLRSGVINCWGANRTQQLAIDCSDARTTCTTRRTLSEARSEEEDFFQVGRAADATSDTVFDESAGASGDNAEAIMGDPTGDSLGNVLTPYEIYEITNATEVSAGAFHSCSLLKDETVKCWGKNRFGQLGNHDKEVPRHTAAKIAYVDSNAKDGILSDLSYRITQNTMDALKAETDASIAEAKSRVIKEKASYDAAYAAFSVANEEYQKAIAKVSTERNSLEALSDAKFNADAALNQKKAEKLYLEKQLAAGVGGVVQADIDTAANSILVLEGLQAVAQANYDNQNNKVLNAETQADARGADLDTANTAYKQASDAYDASVDALFSRVISDLENIKNQYFATRADFIKAIDPIVQVTYGFNIYEGETIPLSKAHEGYKALIMKHAETSTGGVTITITKADNETDITHYIVYWGSDSVTKLTSYIKFGAEEEIIPLAVIEKSRTNLEHTFYTSGLNTKPIDATHLIVVTSNENGEMETGVAVLLNDTSSSTPPFTTGAMYKDSLIPVEVQDDGLGRPQGVGRLINVIQITTGGEQSCALLRDTTVKCWGRGLYGQIGDGRREYTKIPLTVRNTDDSADLSGVVSISGGLNHTCALLADKTVQCWGDSYYGQLGNASNDPNGFTTAQPVSGLTTVEEISAGDRHTCARLSDKTVKCWGWNTSGQLGDNTVTNSPIPVAVSGISTASQISAGWDHSCALLENAAKRTIQCWGRGDSGQLGNGKSGVEVDFPGLSKIPVEVIGF